MRLYYFPVAPNPTKVRVYLAEKGLPLDMERVDLTQGAQRDPVFLAKNPMGKLPVLELADGSFLTESLPIIEYLEERFPRPSMWGETPEERARARSLERHCDLGVLVPVARIVHATRSPLGLPPNPGVEAQARGALQQALVVLDRMLGEGPFVVGDRVTVADCTLCAAFGFARFGQVEIDPTLRNVAAWDERFQKRPSANPA